jgi:PAS domain S-box-containing protein
MKQKTLAKPALRSRNKRPLAEEETYRSMLSYKSAGHYLRAILDSLEDELIVIDRDHRIIEANQTLLRRHGKRRQEVIGKYCYGISHGRRKPCRLPHHECPLKTVWETGQPTRVTHCHVYHVKGEKQERYLDIVASPMKDEGAGLSPLPS